MKMHTFKPTGRKGNQRDEIRLPGDGTLMYPLVNCVIS